jgi:hypothetical protein
MEYDIKVKDINVPAVLTAKNKYQEVAENQPPDIFSDSPDFVERIYFPEVIPTGVETGTTGSGISGIRIARSLSVGLM